MEIQARALVFPRAAACTTFATMTTAPDSPQDPSDKATTRGNATPFGGVAESDPSAPNLVLAAYGTLAPGRSNHREVAEVGGEWLEGTVKGHYWTWRAGPYEGLPALRLDPDGDEIPVAVFVSDELVDHWERIDAFEGAGYRRRGTSVTLATHSDGEPRTVEASIYEAIREPDGYDDR